jgi:photosystem II stability/assembly factor-like uncharacterized protein
MSKLLAFLTSFLAIFCHSVFAQDSISNVDTLKYHNIDMPIKDYHSVHSGFEIWDNKLWLIDDGSGVFYTEDTGKTFRKALKGIEKPNITSITKHKNKLYCSTKYSGLYIYNKKNSRWYRLKKGLVDSIYWSIKSNGQYIFAASEEGGILRSKNGLSWEKLNVFVDNKLNPIKHSITSKTILHTKDSVVFLLMPKRLIVSTNNGKSWKQLHTPVKSSKAIMWHISGRNDTLVISYLYGGTIVSFNGGLNWIEPENNPHRAWSTSVLNNGVWLCNPFQVRYSDNGLYLLKGNTYTFMGAFPNLHYVTFFGGHYFVGASSGKIYRFKYP